MAHRCYFQVINRSIQTKESKVACAYTPDTPFMEATELSSKLLSSYFGSDSNLQRTIIGQISPREAKALVGSDNPHKPCRLQGEVSKTFHRCKMLPVPTDK